MGLDSRPCGARDGDSHYPGDHLAQAILGADVEVFENLYLAYARDAERVARGILHDPELAADAVHAAFLGLFRYILAGKRWHDPADARAAVIRNASWAALNILRARRRRPEAPLAASKVRGDESAWARTEARAVCQQIVARLRPAHQVALRLHFVEGLANAQSADRLGLSVSAFEARLARAVRAARRVARGLGLVGVLALAARVGFRGPRLHSVSLGGGRPGLSSARRAAGSVAAAALVVIAPRLTELQALGTPAGGPVTHRLVAAATGALETLQDATLLDAVRLTGHTAVLLGQGHRCACGVVFITRDAGRTWSSVHGPLSVTTGDHLVITRGGAAPDIVVARADGATFSSPALSSLGSPEEPSADWRPALPVPFPGGRGWMLPLDAAHTIEVGGDGRLRCSADGGVTWSEDCGSTS